LVEHNSVVPAYLGVKLDSTFDSATATSVGLKRPRGARINDVTPGSPAAAAKLQRGDIILEFGGLSVDNDIHLINLVGLTEVGREVPMVVYRDQKAYKINVRIGSAPSEKIVPKTSPPNVQRAR
jgi:serine protease Do